MTVKSALTTLADKIRSYTKKSDKMKLDGMPTEIEAVYKAGQNSVVDESKIIEKTATGTGIVALDDVSELLHEVSVQLTGENVGGKEVKVYGKNLFANNTDEIKEVAYIPTSGIETFRNGYEIYLPNGTYVIRTLLREGTSSGDYIYGCVVDADNKVVQTVNTFADSNSNATTKPIVFDIKDGYVLKIYDGVASTSIPNVQKKFAKYNIQIESEIQTSFEPYIAPTTYTTDTDGKVRIKSVSPNMTIICDDENISVSYRADWGIVSQRQMFWNAVTNNDNRADHERCYGYAWSDDAFRPMTDLTVRKGAMIFIASRIVNLAGCFQKYRKKLDTSKASTLYYAFQNALTQYIPEISLEGITSGTTGTNYTFYSPNIRKIEKLIFKEDGTTPIASTMFTGATGLVEIRIGGVIGNDINFSACPLSRASIDNIFEHFKPFGTVWTETTNTGWWQDPVTGAYPCDKLKVVIEGVPDGEKVELIVSHGSNDTGINDSFLLGNGEFDLSWAMERDDNNGGSCSIVLMTDYKYTIYEGKMPTPKTATFKKTAVESAYNTAEWGTKVAQANDKGWAIELK